MAGKIYATVKYLIGVRYDGVEYKFHFVGELENPAQYCIDRQWCRIDGIRKDGERYTVYTNPYPIITGIAPICWDDDCEDDPCWDCPFLDQ